MWEEKTSLIARNRSVSKWLIVTLLILVCGCAATKPNSVKSAVLDLQSRLSSEDLDLIARNPRSDVVGELHFPIGIDLRNDWGMWSTNRKLLDSCGVSDADTCSQVIFEKLWDAVQETKDLALRQSLNCQFKLMESIQINPAGFKYLQMGQLLDALREQIDSQANPNNLKCGGRLSLVVTGSVPNLTCWTRYEFSETASLHDFLKWASFRNGFKVRNNPPDIELVFYEECAWPRPFNKPNRDG